MGNELKILFLQESLQAGEPIMEVLRGGGVDFDGLVASTRSDFLGALESYNPDVILVEDIASFPVGEALALRQETCPDVPFLLLAHPLSEDAALVLVGRGVTDYVLADRPKRLPAAIRTALGKSRTGTGGREDEKRQGGSESEERYRALFENSVDGILMSEVDGDILAANPTACRLFQMTEEEIRKVGRFGLVDTSDPRLAAGLRERQETGRAQGIITFIRKDGTTFQGEITSAVSRGAEGRAITSIIIRDITEKETHLRRLEEKRAKLLAAQHIAKLGYWELRMVDRSLHWTEEVYRIWGRDPITYTPSLASLPSFIHPEDRMNYAKAQDAALAGLGPLDVEHRILLPDGSVKWARERGNLVRDKAGNPTILEGTVQDITEHKAAMEQLSVSEARHRGIVQSQTNYVIRTDLQGRYSYCNEKFLGDFRWIYPGGKVLGNDSMVSMMDYHRQRVAQTAEKCLETPGRVYQVEIDKPSKEGGVKTTLWDFVCIQDSAGRPAEIQCVGIDISDRVRAERSMQESNARYELVTKATSDAIWDWDLVSGRLYWGEGYQTLFGFKPGVRSTKMDSWTVHLHPDDRERVVADIQAAIEGTETNWECEYRFRKADGGYATVVDRGFVIRDGSNRAVRVVGAMQDLTDKKRLEELLSRATKMARIGSYEVDLVNGTVYLSDMTREIHEVGRDSPFTLDSALEFYKPGLSRQMITYALEEAVEKGVPFDLEVQIVTALGNARWVRVIAEPEVVNGRSTRIYGSFQDIDERKRAELGALRAYEEKDRVLESIGDAFFAVDREWTFTYWNDRAEEVTGRTRKEILSRYLWEVFADAVGTPFDTYYRKAMAENAVQHFEAFYETLRIWYEVSVYPSPGGLSVFCRDVTGRKQSELRLRELNTELQAYTEELVASNKGLEQFSYIVSHNLRAPVANILGLGELLKQQALPEEARRTLLEGLLENVERLDTVIRDLNQVLQVKKEFSERREPVKLTELVDGIQKSIQDLFQSEQVQLLTDFKVEEFSTLRSYLQSILYNLITNSIKYRQPGVSPVIEISSEMTDSGVRITYRDNGLGIDLDKRKNQVFGLYKRFHHHVEGKGMGLFMVKSQVEALGGRISIQSKVNKGTEFTLEFKA